MNTWTCGHYCIDSWLLLSCIAPYSHSGLHLALLLLLFWWSNWSSKGATCRPVTTLWLHLALLTARLRLTVTLWVSVYILFHNTYVFLVHQCIGMFLFTQVCPAIILFIQLKRLALSRVNMRYIYIYIYTHTHTHTQIYTYEHMYTQAHTYICICVYIHLCVCVCVGMNGIMVIIKKMFNFWMRLFLSLYANASCKRMNPCLLSQVIGKIVGQIGFPSIGRASDWRDGGTWRLL